MSEGTSSRTLHCVIVTPERALLDAAAEFVALPLYDGELGVLPGRTPLIGRLGYGELRIRNGTHVERYFVDGGFAQVRANVVTVLTPRAMKGNEIKPEAAAQALQQALTPAMTLQAQEAQSKAQARARAQLRIARLSVGEAPAEH
jgi:F-type H+-transporting ATPase subunit epsilon